MGRDDDRRYGYGIVEHRRQRAVDTRRRRIKAHDSESVGEKAPRIEYHEGSEPDRGCDVPLGQGACGRNEPSDTFAREVFRKVDGPRVIRQPCQACWATRA